MSQKPTDGPGTMHLGRLLGRLLRGTVIVVLLAVVIAAAVWGVGLLVIRPTYTGTAIIQFNDPAIYPVFTNSLIGVTSSSVDRKLLPMQAVDELVTARTLADSSLVAYQNQPQLLERAKDSMECTIVGKTTLQLEVRSADAQLAPALANAWAKTLIAQMNQDNGITEEAVKLLRDRTEDARKHWKQLHQSLASGELTGFEADQAKVDLEVAKNLYAAMAQALEQAQVSHAVAQNAISVALPATPQDQPSNPQPRRYAAIASLIVLAVGLFIVLVVELSRLER